MKINQIIRERRKSLKLTMRQVADAVGVSEGTISRWESGDISNMKRDKIALLAKALKMESSELTDDDSKKIVLGSELKQIITNIAEELNEDYDKLVDLFLNKPFPREINYNSLLYFYSCYLGLPLFISTDTTISTKQKIIIKELKTLCEDDLDKVEIYIEKLQEIRSIENLDNIK